MRLNPYIGLRLIYVRSYSYYLMKQQQNVILFLIFFHKFFPEFFQEF